MKVTICVGSSCHLKGSRLIVEEFQSLIEDNHLQDQVELYGAFCMENCVEGVCVKIEEEIFSLKPENTKSFFEKEVWKRIKA